MFLFDPIGQFTDTAKAKIFVNFVNDLIRQTKNPRNNYNYDLIMY